MTLGRAQENLTALYRRIESAIPVADSPEYASLVVPNGNQSMPVHRWFHLKESYSCQLLAKVLKDTELASRDDLRILDPYAGVGTSCVSAADLLAAGELRRVAVYGVEANGFLHLVAATKLLALQSPPDGFDAFAERLMRSVLASSGAAPEAPRLSTFQVDAYFDRTDVDQLMRLKAAIDREDAAGEIPINSALARVCLGSVVETVGNLRRDGRTLRYVEKNSRVPTLQAFGRLAKLCAEDLPSRPIRIDGRVIRGDGRLLDDIDRRFLPFDLVIYSPPYPNNIDYTEVYKLENWLLDFITDSESFVAQRLRTVYSHPSVLRPDPLPSPLLTAGLNLSLEQVVAPVLSAIPKDRYSEGRRRMVRGYVLDMYLTLRSAKDRLARDGWLVYVVGNSVHGKGDAQLVIAADLLIAEVAGFAGLRVEKLAVARHLRRRVVESPFLRESVVFLRAA